jgi:hypothetical protein
LKKLKTEHLNKLRKRTFFFSTFDAFSKIVCVLLITLAREPTRLNAFGEVLENRSD